MDERPLPERTLPPIHSVWDAGSMSCGDLVLELKRRLAQIPADQALHLIATDPAAPLDIQAWCRVTKNQLLQFHHPHYFLQRKDP